MKKFLLGLLISFCALQSFGAHIKGGFFNYEYLGPGIVDPSKDRYKITLTVYSSPAPTVGPGPSTQIWSQINFTLFQGANGPQLASIPVDLALQKSLIKTYASPCISGSNLTGIYYDVFIYVLNNYELAPSVDGYTFSYQKCCRLGGMDNVANSNTVGNTWTIHIPGTTPIPNGNHNSSPLFLVNDTLLVCAENYFTYSFAATDADGDSLSYSFCDAYPGGSQTVVNPDPSSPPPYSSIPYSPPFSGSQPLGSQVTIDPVTGVVSGIAPSILNSGEYVVTVCVSEFREHTFFAQSRKELHIRVKSCQPLSAVLNPKPVTCDGFTVNFQNDAGGNPPLTTIYQWIFGEPSSGANDTSNLPAPSHTYADTGVYHVRLVMSLAGQCADTAYLDVKVYPGFFTGFTVGNPLCKGVPVQFNDTSHTIYGVIDSWSWDFGDPATLADTSHLKNPTYIYPNAGIYSVTQTVTNSKGCVDTKSFNVTILDKPPLSAFPKDTTYCALDTLQLNAVGTGNFTWTPNYNILNANTAFPSVFPLVPTKYYVTANDQGCINTDSVTVNPLNDLTASITASNSNICEEDTITLTGNANHPGVTWQWNNPGTLSSPTGQVTQAFPIVTTNYILNVKWGNNCVVNPNKLITVKQLASPNAGPDKNICKDQASVQLNASGGNTYTWTPAATLSNPNISNPVASPTDTTSYIVSVGVTGCSKTRNDTVIVFVNALPTISATNDTLICNIDTLQLNANGTGTFLWSPNYMISSVNSQNPLVSPDVPTKYYVVLTDGNGCKNRDSVFVDVKSVVALNAGPDTAICRNDGFTINTVSDGLHFLWTPPTYLDDPTKKNPFTTPLTNITYHVVANIGKCQSQDDITIKSVPFPAANAGPDTTICFGYNVQLNATGGSSYVWSPATFLTTRFIANPTVISPTANIRYVVTITDTLGCPKPVRDTVWVRVYPKVIADAGPRDTSVVEGEPLLLNATGGTTYLWDPGTWLTSTTIANPVSLPLNNIEYHLLARSAAGCEGRDTILVKLYKIDASIYVPTAFTPNGDGLNDDLKPILIGMKSLAYFKIYNRWGQMVFSTSDINHGWDGKFGGKGQDPATYVWEAAGLTYKNQLIKKKGYAVLIR